MFSSLTKYRFTVIPENLNINVTHFGMVVVVTHSTITSQRVLSTSVATAAADTFMSIHVCYFCNVRINEALNSGCTNVN